MPVIAVVNRKGGSGKSTLAAHLAAWYAHQGNTVMLGDVDRQQSTRSWLRKRSEALPAIAPWTVDQNILRVPTGVTHVVLDTPGGLHGFDLARMVMFADVILMPVCGSSFDRESAAGCHAELMTLPRVASGRCKLACIGMRLDVRSRAPQVLKEWAEDLGMPFLGVLRETQSYVQCLERGMTLFDLAPERVATDLQQWQSILSWLDPVLASSAAAASGTKSSAAQSAARAPAPLPSRLLAPRPGPLSTRPVTATTPVSAPAAYARPASVAQPTTATPAAQRILASRPMPTVTRLNSPRVLDRVASTSPSHPAPAPASSFAPEAVDDSPPIPSFLKLVKC